MSLTDSEPHPDVTLGKQSDSKARTRPSSLLGKQAEAYTGGALTHVPTLPHSTFICIPSGYILPTYPLGRLPYDSRWL